MKQLAAANFSRLIGIIVQRETRVAFQNSQLIVILRARFEDDRGPGNCDRDCFAGNFRGAGIFSRVNQDRAAIESDTAARFVKTENRVRAETRDREVGKRELGSRIVAGAQSGAVVNFVVNRRRFGRSLLRQKLNIVKNGSDFALRRGRWRLRPTGDDRCRGNDREQNRSITSSHGIADRGEFVAINGRMSILGASYLLRTPQSVAIPCNDWLVTLRPRDAVFPLSPFSM